HIPPAFIILRFLEEYKLWRIKVCPKIIWGAFPALFPQMASADSQYWPSHSAVPAFLPVPAYIPHRLFFWPPALRHILPAKPLRYFLGGVGDRAQKSRGTFVMNLSAFFDLA